VANEFEFIDWLRARTPAASRVLVGPGDDCAVLTPGERPQVVTTDMLMDGVDFIVAEVGPRRVGRKAMAVNLSDIAAMAAVPTSAVVSVALPKSNNFSFAEELYLGLRDVADAFGVPIVGGDTNTWHGPLVVTVTAFGEATERGAVLRSGAQVGDAIFVTGPLGGSIRGHHLDFVPRVREALALHAAVELRAMLDISDGLSADLHHICERSGVGAVLFADAIPTTDIAQTMENPLERALGDGEDFELVFTVSARDAAKLLREPPVPVWRIGEIVAKGYWLQTHGERRELRPTGWVHTTT
jgi:thiamine-monophosphate kinase